MNEARESFSSTGSRVAQGAINWLVGEMGLTDRQAKLVFYGNGGASKVDILNLFVKHNEMYTHLFCPQEGLCEICGETAESHTYIYNEKYQAILERVVNENENDFVEEIGELVSDRVQTIQCGICDGEFYPSDIASIQGKLHDICEECFGMYLREEISNARVLEMKCPHCSLKLESKVVAQFVDAITYKKYKIFLSDKQMMKNPDLRWCPNPRCGKVVNVKLKSGKVAKCVCGTQICTKCNREGHGKLTCKEVFEKETKEWEDVIDVQNCKKCHSLVEKVSGCNHMTCQVCKYEWCWLCKSSYSSIHFSALNPFGCPGLQNGDHLSQNWGCFRRSLYRFGLFLLILILIPLALPIGMLIAGPTLAITFIKDRTFYWNMSNCQKFPVIVLCILLGLVLNPIAWIGLLGYFVPIGIMALIEYYRGVKDMEEASSNRLREKLIEEANFDEPVIQ